MAEVKPKKTHPRRFEDIKHKIMPFLYRRNLKLIDLADKTGIRYDMLCGKVRGKRPFTPEDMVKIGEVLQASMYKNRLKEIIIRNVAKGDQKR